MTNSVSEGKILFIVAAVFDEFAFKSFVTQLKYFEKIWYHLHYLKYRHL